MSHRGPDNDRNLAAELRRLYQAALFFAVCLLVVVALALVGLYH
jgi:nitrate reductase NapE component